MVVVLAVVEEVSESCGPIQPQMIGTQKYKATSVMIPKMADFLGLRASSRLIFWDIFSIFTFDPGQVWTTCLL